MAKTAAALHRARVLPLWAAVLMALSQPVHLVSAVISPRAGSTCSAAEA